jgi:hypothetical protein
MFIKKSVCVVAFSLSLCGVAAAADCVLHVTRTSCPGEEKESFSKCQGKASCDEKVLATSAAQCASKAKSACANSRLTITKYKKVNADYDGAAVEGGKDFCTGHPDYPHAKKADCKG